MTCPFPQPAMQPALHTAAQPLPLVAPVDIDALQRLRTWMALLEGRRVNVARLCVDRIYAYELLAQAHASDCEPLRELAVSLFAAYESTRTPTTH